jgi:hypothetical protein
VRVRRFQLRKKCSDEEKLQATAENAAGLNLKLQAQTQLDYARTSTAQAWIALGDVGC